MASKAMALDYAGGSKSNTTPTPIVATWRWWFDDSHVTGGLTSWPMAILGQGLVPRNKTHPAHPCVCVGLCLPHGTVAAYDYASHRRRGEEE